MDVWMNEFMDEKGGSGGWGGVLKGICLFNEWMNELWWFKGKGGLMGLS